MSSSSSLRPTSSKINKKETAIAVGAYALLLSVALLGDGCFLPIQTGAHWGTLLLLAFLIPGRFKTSPLNKPLLLWLLWNVLSISWSVHPSTAMQTTWVMGDGILLFYIATNIRETVLSINWPLMFVGTIFPALIVGMILEKDFASFFPNANLLGSYVLMIIFIPWMIFFGSPNSPEGKGRKIISLGLAVLGTAILYRSGSRTAILVWLLVMGSALFRPQEKRHWQWSLLGLGAAVSWIFISKRRISILSSLMDRRFGSFMSRGKVLGASPFHDRWRWWKSAARVVKDHPLAGVGIGNFSVVSPLHDTTKTLHSLFAHSGPLQIASETGLIGLGLAGVLILYSVRWIRSAPPTPLQRGLVLGLAAVLIENLSDYNLSVPAHWMLFCWMAGLACPAREPALECAGRNPDGTLAPALVALAFCLILFGMDGSSRAWRAQRWARLGATDIDSGHIEETQNDLRQSRRLDASSFEALTLSFHLQTYLSLHEGPSHLEQIETELNDWRRVPMTGEFWRVLAVYWEQRGEKQRAKWCLNTAVSVNPLLSSSL